MNDLELQSPPTHATDPWTSYHAAEKIRGKSGSIRQTLLVSLAENGPQTVDELCERHHLVRSSAGTRITELTSSKLVHWDGRTRPNRNGNQSNVWQLTPLGWDTFRALRIDKNDAWHNN